MLRATSPIKQTFCYVEVTSKVSCVENCCDQQLTKSIPSANRNYIGRSRKYTRRVQVLKSQPKAICLGLQSPSIWVLRPLKPKTQNPINPKPLTAYPPITPPLYCGATKVRLTERLARRPMCPVQWAPSSPQGLLALAPRASSEAFKYYIGVSRNLGYLFGGSNQKDYSILVSILGCPYFGKLFHIDRYAYTPQSGSYRTFRA